MVAAILARPPDELAVLDWTPERQAGSRWRGLPDGDGEPVRTGLEHIHSNSMTAERGCLGRDQHEPSRPVRPTAPLNQRGPWIGQRPEPGRPRLARVPTRQPAAHRLDLLERAVRALTVKYRAPLILRDIEGLSTTEAAAVLGLSEAAFKSRLHRARLSVRDAVRDHPEHEA